MIRQVALLWRADHFEIALTIEESPNPPARSDGITAESIWVKSMSRR
jgi:hypothetical protein